MTYLLFFKIVKSHPVGEKLAAPLEYPYKRPHKAHKLHTWAKEKVRKMSSSNPPTSKVNTYTANIKATGLQNSSWNPTFQKKQIYFEQTGIDKTSSSPCIMSNAL